MLHQAIILSTRDVPDRNYLGISIVILLPSTFQNIFVAKQINFPKTTTIQRFYGQTKSQRKILIAKHLHLEGGGGSKTHGKF